MLSIPDDIDRFVDFGSHHLVGLEIGQSGRVEYVGAGLGEGLQAPDCFGQVSRAEQVTFGSGGEQEGEVASRLSGSRNACNCAREVVDRGRRIIRGVLDRSANQTPCAVCTSGVCAGFWIGAETVAEVRRHGEIGRIDCGGVVEYLGAAQRSQRITLAGRVGVPALVVARA